MPQKGFICRHGVHSFMRFVDDDGKEYKLVNNRILYGERKECFITLCPIDAEWYKILRILFIQKTQKT